MARLPKLDEQALASMSPADRAGYHAERSRIFGRRAIFFAKLAIACAAISVALQIMRAVIGHG